MKKRKIWIAVVASVLLLALLGGAVASLLPRSPVTEAEECLHDNAKLVKTETTADASIFTYWCRDCDDRFDRTMTADVFVDNIPKISGSSVTYLGNWTVGDHYENVYTVFDAVHDDVDQYESKWLVRSDATSLWNGTGGFNPHCAASSYKHRIGVASGGHDVSIAWTAPRDGVVMFGATDFEIISPSNSYNLSVWHNTNRVAPESGFINLSRDGVNDNEDFTIVLSNVRVNVKAGDKIYFRASRITEGANESFMPLVTYVDHIPHLR